MPNGFPERSVESVLPKDLVRSMQTYVVENGVLVCSKPTGPKAYEAFRRLTSEDGVDSKRYRN